MFKMVDPLKNYCLVTSDIIANNTSFEVCEIKCHIKLIVT